jgi:DNA processing protein
MEIPVRPSADEERQAWLAWASLPEIGPRTLEHFLRVFGSLLDAWNAPDDAFRSIGVSEKLVTAIRQARTSFNPVTARATLDRSAIRAVLLTDPDYPPLLREIADPPFVLFVRGSLPTGPVLSIVGTRLPSAYGRLMTERLTSAAVRCGYGVVSGLAYGIDAAAHAAALESGGKTFAVFACGLDRVYPAANEALAERILQSGGGWLSEHPPGTEALKFHFPRRNRIIAGLSFGSLVVEAGERSGALITARLALDANREVLAVPGPATSAQSVGPHRLIRQGAQLIASEDDLCLALGQSPTQTTSIDRGSTSPDQAVLLTLLAQEPLDVDQLIEKSRMTSGRVLGLCARLELEGRIRKLNDAKYALLG